MMQLRSSLVRLPYEFTRQSQRPPSRLVSKCLTTLRSTLYSRTCESPIAFTMSKLRLAVTLWRVRGGAGGTLCRHSPHPGNNASRRAALSRFSSCLFCSAVKPVEVTTLFSRMMLFAEGSLAAVGMPAANRTPAIKIKTQVSSGMFSERHLTSECSNPRLLEPQIVNLLSLRFFLLDPSLAYLTNIRTLCFSTRTVVLQCLQDGCPVQPEDRVRRYLSLV